MVQRAAKRSLKPIQERKSKPLIDFFMVIMASGFARGRVRVTEKRKVAAIFQLIVCSVIILSVRYSMAEEAWTSFGVSSQTWLPYIFHLLTNILPNTYYFTETCSLGLKRRSLIYKTYVLWSGGRSELCFRHHAIARPMILAIVTSVVNGPWSFNGR